MPKQKSQDNKLEIKYQYGFRTKTKPIFQTKPGLTKKTIKEISQYKKEPKFMMQLRLKAYQYFLELKMPKWSPDITKLDFNKIVYFSNPTEKTANSWEKLPKAIKNTYDRIGVPAAERDFLAGVSAQYDSSVVYESLKKTLDRQGIIFCDTDTALQKYSQLFKQYFAKLVSLSDNKFASLNSAVWSGGSFLYVPKNTKVKLPLQAYFRINSASFGQFERTLIIADEGSSVHYIEGCTAPIYRSKSLHAAVVEVFAKKGARVKYTTVQNWSNNIYNLVTKRAKAEKDATVEWIDINIGSRLTMKYPAIILSGKNARGSMLSIAYAQNGQSQDTGAKMIHLAPKTTSSIVSKSISVSSGVCSYRGSVKITKKATYSKNNTRCDSLILDDQSISNTYPDININNNQSNIEHEATVEKLSEKKLSYLQSRGLTKEQAEGILVNGFIDPITKQLPLEYSVELYRLINLEMKGAIG